jgi:hypothetical protein
MAWGTEKYISRLKQTVLIFRKYYQDNQVKMACGT